MQLPKEHITPRLESLPKDLRRTAENIIANKFKITANPVKKPVPQKTKSEGKMGQTYVVNVTDPIQRLDTINQYRPGQLIKYYSQWKRTWVYGKYIKTEKLEYEPEARIWADWESGTGFMLASTVIRA